MGRGQLLSVKEAVMSIQQHKTPCSDCPWRRDALPGWLGGRSALEWLQVAHGDGKIECHTLLCGPDEGWECAGAAMYRANVAKITRDPTLLRLPRSPLVFGSPREFLAHHDDGEET